MRNKTVAAGSFEQYQAFVVKECERLGLKPVFAAGLPDKPYMGQDAKGFTKVLFTWWKGLVDTATEAKYVRVIE